MALTDNLVAYWKLEEASGNRVDSAGTNTLTDVNTVTSAAGKQGNAASFASATSEALSCAGNANLNTGDIDFTFACWARPTTVTGFPCLASKGWAASGATREWCIFYDSGATSLWFSVQSPTAEGGIAATIALATATWYFVVIWHDSAANTINIQVNDGTIFSTAHPNGLAAGTGAFKLGSSDPAHGLFWNGLIDEAGFWRRVLTASERTELYNAGVGTTYPFTVPTYFGSSAAVPVDGAAAVNATATITLTPPASMALGNLVAVVCCSRVSATWTNGVTGGQTWTAEAAFQGTAAPFACIFWCTFNGTWAANPRFDSTSATCTSAVMHVFTPTATSKVWSVDVVQATTVYAAPTTPFTVTRAGLTTLNPETVTLAIWAGSLANAWTTLAGTGWVVTGGAQYRNTSGSDTSMTFAHHLDAAASTVVPSTSKNQATVTGGAGVTAILSWYAGVAVAAGQPYRKRAGGVPHMRQGQHSIW